MGATGRERKNKSIKIIYDFIFQGAIKYQGRMLLFFLSKNNQLLQAVQDAVLSKIINESNFLGLSFFLSPLFYTLHRLKCGAFYFSMGVIYNIQHIMLPQLRQKIFRKPDSCAAKELQISIICFQVLDFPQNPIEVLENDVFMKKNLLNLQAITLTSCKIRSIELHAFRY